MIHTSGIAPVDDGEPSALPVLEFLDPGRMNDIQIGSHLVELDHGGGDGGRFNGTGDAEIDTAINVPVPGFGGGGAHTAEYHIGRKILPELLQLKDVPDILPDFRRRMVRASPGEKPDLPVTVIGHQALHKVPAGQPGCAQNDRASLHHVKGITRKRRVG